MPAPRLAPALFLVAFGFALLSVCLFRVMAFGVSSTVFFVLYLAAAMPLGAYVAERWSLSTLRGLRIALVALVVLSLCLPAIGWLATRGPSMFAASALEEFQVQRVWQRLGYQLMIVGPFFAAWGFAEFIGYQLALASKSRLLQNGFYLIFVWALACALAVAYWTIPAWGLLRTLALGPAAAALASGLVGQRAPGTPSRKRTRVRQNKARLGFGAAALALAIGGSWEHRYIAQLYMDAPFNVGRALGAGHTESSILSESWGAFSHITLVEQRNAERHQVLGAYDGTIFWTVDADEVNHEERAIFGLIPEGGSVAVLGAGGGRQVSMALDRNPRSIVAVDVIPEVFELFNGDNAWANKDAYRSPVVDTVAADGRRYMAESGEDFDFIWLPNTESLAAATRSLFEPGSRLHTVEGLRTIGSRLAPDGVMAIRKMVDKDERLFRSYAASLQHAGLHVIGWVNPAITQAGQRFLLLASRSPTALEPDAKLHSKLSSEGYRFVDFRIEAPGAEPIWDSSPWILGVLGTWMIPPGRLRELFGSIMLVGLAGIVALLGFTLLRRGSGESLMDRGSFVLAGVAVGAHAVCLQNGVIFWLIDNLWNPMSSFFVGTSIFLAGWGLSSTMLKRWPVLLSLGTLGVLALFASPTWNSPWTLVAMGCVALGSGLSFPLLGVSYPGRMLGLFTADAMGGFVGGLIGIAVPFLWGIEHYFGILPWVGLFSLGSVVLSLFLRHRFNANATPH